MRKGLSLWLLCALAIAAPVLAGCRGEQVLPPASSGLEGGAQGPEGAAEGVTPIGHWIYASGESEGATTDVSGDLDLRADATFTDNRYIGGIGAFREGTFTIEGTSLTLTFDGGASTQVYSFSLSSAVDADGKVFDTLLLAGDGLSFLLTRSEV
jgi:hypothetical protein